MKSIRKTACASLLTLAIASTAMAGNIGGMKTTKDGNIGGLSTSAGNIGGLRATTGNIGGLRTDSNTRETTESQLNGITVYVAGNIGGLLSVFFSMF
jgi:hypothetical protein